MVNKNIAIISNSSWSIYNFRRSLIADLQNRNYKVFVIASKDEYSDLVSNIDGIRFIILKQLLAQSLNPWNDIKLTYELVKIFRANRIDVAFTFTPKPNIYSSIASYFVRTKTIPTINGLGIVFNKLDFKRRIVENLYKFAFFKHDLIFFQNQDDKNLFCNRSIVNEKNTVIINGSGINTNQFSLKRYSKFKDANLVFTYCGRLIKEKGCLEFLEAATVITKKYKNVLFQVFGAVADNPNAIKKEKIINYEQEGLIFFRGQTDNMNEVLENSDVLVYPSYYREGIPRILIEGLSKGLPIITCDSIGCKECIINNYNGFSVKPKDIQDLVLKIEQMILLPFEERIEMGINSRKLALSKFDEDAIIQKYTDTIQQFLS